MKKRPKPFLHAVECHAARALAFGLAMLPLGAAAWTGRRLGDIARLADRRHRERAREQAAERLGISGRELDAFVKANFHSYGMTLAEFAHLTRMKAGDIRRHVELCGFEERVAELRSIARPLDNPGLNDFVRSVRERTGMGVFDKEGAIRRALAALRANDCVCVLLDQDAGRRGLMSPFLGRPASTVTIPIELAVRTGCPMLLAGMRRNGSGTRFTLLQDGKTYRANPDAADAKAEVRRLTDDLNAGLSAMIMQAPEQWFWIHRRWKNEGRKQ